MIRFPVAGRGQKGNAEAAGLESRRDILREQHKARVSAAPHLYFEQMGGTKLHLAWMRTWQERVRSRLASLEAVELDPDCFIAESAQIFAEPHRVVRLKKGSSVAAFAYVHGPLTLGERSSINVQAHLEGGGAGIVIGNDVRIASGARLFAFEHGMTVGEPIRTQATTSRGIVIDDDVWIGANAVITDGVKIGPHAVVGAGAVVTRDVLAYQIVGGVPARVIGDRRTWPEKL